jgi:hypothetical protein
VVFLFRLALSQTCRDMLLDFEVGAGESVFR